MFELNDCSAHFPSDTYVCVLFHQILYESCEGELFSMERLLLKLARNDSTPIDTLSVSLPCLEPIMLVSCLIS